MADHTHGVTKTGYNKGCRHPDCIAANNTANTVSRERAQKKEIPDHVHGTANGRNYWGCDCTPCKEANSAACKDRREKRKKWFPQPTSG